MGLIGGLLMILYCLLGNFASSTLESGAGETGRSRMCWPITAIITAGMRLCRRRCSSARHPLGWTGSQTLIHGIPIGALEWMQHLELTVPADFSERELARYYILFTGDYHWNRQIKTNLEQLRPLPKKVREDGSA
jgi:hypothetical protein